VESSCEFGIEPSKILGNYQVSKELGISQVVLRSMELVMCIVNVVCLCARRILGLCCVALSEASGPSSVSESHADSRAETTTSTTQGRAGSSSADSTFPRNWKELSTQSEREYEQCKNRTGKLNFIIFSLLQERQCFVTV
jgi:hypothetical protein